MRAGFLTFVLVASGWARHSLAAQCSTHLQITRVLEAADGRPAYVESPVVVPTKGGLLLLGVPSWIWAERDAFDPFPSKSAPDTAAYVARLRRNIGFIGFLLGRDQTATPVRPPFAWPARKLVALSGPDGVMHMAWYAPPTGSSNPDAEGTLWYAERHDDQWTVPTMVFSADRFDWSGHKAALMVGRNSEVHLVVPYYRGKTSGIAYIRRTNGRWTTTETTLGGLPSQVTAQLVGTDSLAVAFARVGAPGVRVRNGQHVFLFRVALSDTVWPAPTLVHYSGLDGVWLLGMHAAPSTDGKSQALTLVWNRTAQGRRASADTVYAMVSENAGATWHSPQLLPLPSKLATLSQASDPKGKVHVVMTTGEILGAPAANVFHAVLGNGQWSGLDSLATGKVDSSPTLSSIGGDTLLLAWGNARPANTGSPGTIAPVSKYATLVSACPRDNHP